MIKIIIVFIILFWVTFLIYHLIERILKIYRTFNIKSFLSFEKIIQQFNSDTISVSVKLGLSIIVLIFLYLIIQKIIIVFPFAIISFFIPEILLNFYRKRRISKFNNQLIPALKFFANSLRAGASLSQAIENVVENSTPPLSEEFSKIMNEIKLGISLEDALYNLNTRVKSNDLSIFVTTVNISRQTGGSLSEILDSISETMIERNKLDGKIKSLTAQGKMSGYVVSAMPFALMIILYFMSPELIEPMFNTGFGQITLVFVFFLVGIGSLLIKKIVSIDI